MTGEDGAGLAELTGESLELFAQLDTAGLRAEVETLTNGLGGEELDFGGVLEQLKEFEAALPRMEDEEIGRTLSLLDGYLGEEAASGETIRVFVNSGYNKAKVRQAIKEYFAGDRVEMEVLPAGVIQPDIRGADPAPPGYPGGFRRPVGGYLRAVNPLTGPGAGDGHPSPYAFSLPPGGRGEDKDQKGPLLPVVTPVVRPGQRRSLVLAGLSSFRSAYPLSLRQRLFSRRGPSRVRVFPGRREVSPVEPGGDYRRVLLGLSFTAIMRDRDPGRRPGLLQFLNRWKMVMK